MQTFPNKLQLLLEHVRLLFPRILLHHPRVLAFPVALGIGFAFIVQLFAFG